MQQCFVLKKQKSYLEFQECFAFQKQLCSIKRIVCINRKFSGLYVLVIKCNNAPFFRNKNLALRTLLSSQTTAQIKRRIL